MYKTCLFCHHDLGRNEALATLAIGRRVAFDSAKGRLWVVCAGCGRWNLTPFEERWETLEECERLFRDTRLRFATDNVGLAQPAWGGGFELVRIGRALQPEIAAWRYGSKILSRAPTVAGYAKSLGVNRKAVMRLRTMSRKHEVLARVRHDREAITIRFAHLAHAELLRPDRDQTWRVQVRHDHGTAALEGADALRAARVMLTALNDGSAPEALVSAALDKLDDAGRPHSYFGRVAALALNSSWGRRPVMRVTSGAEPADADRSLAERLIIRLTARSFWARGGTNSEERTLLHWISDVDRLALEMAANEDVERRALSGELAQLAQLEEAWREAEEIAAIADRLLA
ncbi:MAG: hypothetical protein WD801_07500 [Gemmatimonadaceae bacterium]